MSDPLKYFRIEAREILEQLQSGLLELERSALPAEGVAKLLRLAHTLKGAARVVRQPEIANHSHQLEDLLVPLRGSGQAILPAQSEALLAIVDALAALVARLSDAPNAAPAAPAPAAPAAPAPAAPAPAALTGPGGDEAQPRVRPVPTEHVEHIEGLMDGLSEVGFQLSSLRQGLPSLVRSRSLAEQLMERLDPRRGELGAGARIALRSLASELEVRLAKLEREAATGLERATRELGQARDRVDQLQLVAAGSIFGTLERTTRDAAVSLGKRATFEGRGGEIRLDADVLNAVQRALVQAVRNAVAHGIEPSAERGARGKPVEGRVVVDVARRGKRIEFVCQDDGRGVDLAQVRREAERLGHLRASGANQPSSDELVALLLQGGISTSATVTEVAGRGVGLDLIREALAAVGGRVALRTREGAGTTLELSVPASLTALEALVVEANEQICALPLNAVVKAVRVPGSALSRSAESLSLAFEDQLLPFVPLARLLGGGERAERERPFWSVVVVRAREGLLALGVDRLLGSEGLVARLLPDSVEVSSTIASVSLDNDGNPRLLLDPDGLLTAARHERPRPMHAPAQRRAILVVDDSLTTRMLEQSILESAGYEVELATSGEQGLARARARSFDLLLIDVEMPGMDGFQVIEQLRADARLAATPAVLVTSRVSSEDLARGRAAGANGHIAKGEFDQVAFLELIARLVT